MQYRGRFAPSPTGPLHFGSLISAVGSYLQARSQQGVWLVRIEDIDPPREVPGATRLILDALEAYGFQWDEEITYQSTRTHLYAQALDQLQEHSFPCTCSRKGLRANAQIRQAGTRHIYPGTCRSNTFPLRQQHAIRIRTNDQLINFEDRIQGSFEQKLDRDVGDFIIKRSDGHYAYQLAVVVDDAEQHISEVVRGSDLLDNTPRQLYLQQLLKLSRPDYMHLPIAVDQQGIKLSKQTFAEPVDLRYPVPALWRTLAYLGQQPPQELQASDLQDFWSWAIQNWTTDNISRVMHIPENPAKT